MKDNNQIQTDDVSENKVNNEIEELKKKCEEYLNGWKRCLADFDNYKKQQAKFFETIIPAIQKRPQIKFASIFALHDFDEKGCKGLIGYYGMGGLFSLTQQGKDFQGFLCSLGLLREDGTPKPSWDAAMKAFAQLK